MEVTLANFRRNHPRRIVRCSLCTPNRWKGNHKGRFTEPEDTERRRDIVADEVTVRTKSPRRNWSRNKKIRSLRGRLAGLLEKQAKSEKRQLGPNLGWLVEKVREIYRRQIKNCEQELAELEG